MIRYKLIKHERMEDAPFIGALISSVGCNFNCKDCFNQEVKTMPTKKNTSDDIVSQIKSNPFNKGVIFAGLEWTLQIKELNELAKECKQNKLLTMLYTGNDFEWLKSSEVDINNFDYIKCGLYNPKFKCSNNVQYGVKLATSNQKIYKKGVDY